MADASTRLSLLSFCASLVDGIEPSSCPVTLCARRQQKFFSVCTPVSNSSYVQNFVGSFSTYGAIRLYASSMRPSISADCKNSS